ncbi:hypothetical protein BZG83_15415 [Salinivibrio sp. PR919]|nr:hypothetical protein BZG83_15415 [Salinivibrio sp. PR919]OOF15905.1 hypothetical protein BZG84_11405 [Salinivibrio sp. PR932]
MDFVYQPRVALIGLSLQFKYMIFMRFFNVKFFINHNALMRNIYWPKCIDDSQSGVTHATKMGGAAWTSSQLELSEVKGLAIKNRHKIDFNRQKA